VALQHRHKDVIKKLTEILSSQKHLLKKVASNLQNFFAIFLIVLESEILKCTDVVFNMLHHKEQISSLLQCPYKFSRGSLEQEE
jgi:hypothetical protein